MEDNTEETPNIIERELEVVSYNDQKQKVLNHVITIKDKMGEGSFSKVYQVDYLFKWDEEGETKEMTMPYAMKVLDTEQLGKKYNLTGGNDKKTYLDVALEELAIFKKIRHDNIIKVFEIIHGEGKLYMVMELANIGSVMTWDNSSRKYNFTPEIKKSIEERSGEILSQEQVDWESIKDRELVAKFIFKQLFEAVSFIHEKNVVHRDIKWENILAKYNSEENRIECKLIDFSVGKILESKDEKAPKFEGTLEYGSPDAISGEPYDAMKADIWALGVCLYTLIWGNLPQESEKPFLEVIQQSEEISEELKDLLQGMLQSDPELRSSAEDLSLSLWLL